MLARLSPFRYIAMAVFALLLASLFLRSEPPGSPKPAGETKPPVAQPVATRPVPTAPPVSLSSAANQPTDVLRPVPPLGPATEVRRVETQDPVVFLTIDDGGFCNPSMADILKRNGIRATFFLTERLIQSDLDCFRRLRDDTGGVIENHSATHPNLRGWSREKQFAEIGPVADRYAAEFGRRPTLFRAPYGNCDSATLQAAGDAGVKYVVRWDAELKRGTMSFAGPHQLVPGSIVLMHFGPNIDADVNGFIAQARKNGLTPALLTDYLR